jgi:hypothetical protein
MFANALAQAESGGNYGAVNSLGYTGKYQFGDARLDDFRRATGQSFTMDDFRQNPEMQEAAFAWHLADIDRAITSRGLDRFIGQTINGVPITLDGLRAMAHLGGIGGMTQFVTSGGRYNPSDAYGTSLSDYATRFAGASPVEQPETAGNALAPRRDAMMPPSPQMTSTALQLSDFQMDPAAFMRPTNSLRGV